MNIFMITSVPLNPPWDQGDKNIAYTLTQALGEHKFRVLTLRHGLLPEGDNLHLQPLYRSRNPTIIQKMYVFWHFLNLPSLIKSALVANGKPDLFHLIYQPTTLSSQLNRLLPEFKHRPTLHTVPAVSSGKLSPNLFFANQLVAISRYGRKLLIDLGFENVAYIPPGIDFDTWASLPSKRSVLKSHLGLSDQPVLLYPGHYAPGYGIDVILRALPLIVALIPRVQILFACRFRSQKDRKRELEIRGEIIRLGLEQNVHQFSTVSDMRALVGASDLTVLPLETMQNKVDIPITLLESMAAGVPIIISDLAPMNELLNPPAKEAGIAGLAIPAGEAEALAQAVVDLLKDKKLRNRLAENGQKLVHQQNDSWHIACQYDRIYHELSR